MLLFETLSHTFFPVRWIDRLFPPQLTAVRMPFYGAEDDLKVNVLIGMLTYAELS